MGAILGEFLPADAVETGTSILKADHERANEYDLQTLLPSDSEFLRRTASRRNEMRSWMIEIKKLQCWRSYHLSLNSIERWTKIRDELSRVKSVLLGDVGVIRNSTGPLRAQLESAAQSCCASIIETIESQTSPDFPGGLVALWKASVRALLSELPVIIANAGSTGCEEDLKMFYGYTEKLEKLLDPNLCQLIIPIKQECAAIVDGGDLSMAYCLANRSNKILKEVIEEFRVVSLAVALLTNSYITVCIETAETLMGILLPNVRFDSPVMAASFPEGSAEYEDKELILPWAKSAVKAAELIADDTWQLDTVLDADQIKEILSKISRGIMLTLLLSSELKF